jgi:hypothetical protein
VKLLLLLNTLVLRLKALRSFPEFTVIGFTFIQFPKTCLVDKVLDDISVCYSQLIDVFVCTVLQKVHPFLGVVLTFD